MGGINETKFRYSVLAERRRFPRYFCVGSVEILQSGRLWGWGRVDEISRCGCYIDTNHPLPSGTQAQLRLTIAETSLDVCANVVCTIPQVGMGMDFLVETPEQRTKLTQIVEEVKANVLQSSAVLQAGAISEEADHMQAALHHSQQAQEELLQETMHDEAGHRARALHLTEVAIHEVKKARRWSGPMGTIVPASVMSGFGLNCEVQ